MSPNSDIFEYFDEAGVTRHGLPGALYIDDRLFAVEQRQLFSQNWMFVGFAHEMPNAGDARPIEAAGLPLFLLRGKDEVVRAYHNVCRHRNLKLIDKDCNTGRMVRCPYHSWSYDLCGKLKNAPYFGGSIRQLPEDFRYEDHSLKDVHCELWHDWIFINLSDDPPDFAKFLEPIERQLGDVNLSDFQVASTLEFGEISCNWKLLMENFIEPYHVQFVHSSTTDQPLVDHYTVADEHCLGSAVELSEKQLANARQGTLGVTSHYLTLFPNFVMGTYWPDQIGVHLNTPVEVGKTRQKRVIYLHKESQHTKQKIQDLSDLWHSVHLEDHEMCVRLQKGRLSPMSQYGGVLSPCWENSVRKFQQLVAETIRPVIS